MKLLSSWYLWLELKKDIEIYVEINYCGVIDLNISGLHYFIACMQFTLAEYTIYPTLTELHPEKVLCILKSV